MKADVALASSTNGEGALVTQRRGRREDERVEEGARHGVVRAGAAGGSAERRLALTAAQGRGRSCRWRAFTCSADTRLFWHCTEILLANNQLAVCKTLANQCP